MKIKVKTESGSIYCFKQEEDGIHVMKGSTTGKVIAYYNGPIVVGKPMSFCFQSRGNTDPETASVQNSTPVIEISVEL